jgi:hypothetical protein
VATIVPYWDLIQYDLNYYSTALVQRIRGTTEVPAEAVSVEITEKVSAPASTIELSEKTGLYGEYLSAPVAVVQVNTPPSTPSRSASSSSFLSTISDRSARVSIGVVDPFEDYTEVAEAKPRESSIPFPMAAKHRSPSRSRSSRSSSIHSSEENDIFGLGESPFEGLPMPATTPPKRRSSAHNLARQASFEVNTMPSLFQRASEATVVAMPSFSRRSSAASVHDVESRQHSIDSSSHPRKDSFGRRGSRPGQDWQGKDSVATLFDGGSWRPSMTARTSSSTLVEGHGILPVGRKIANAHSRFQGGFQNPFAKYDPRENEELDIQVVGQKGLSIDPRTPGPFDRTPTKLSPVKQQTYRGQPIAGNLPKAGLQLSNMSNPFAQVASVNNHRVA